ncbi:MAG: hypothetical protein NWR72_01990 [Bacteroidia bacterium]|nr:hypothetical protein [Bacteroidia bacterium]
MKIVSIALSVCLWSFASISVAQTSTINAAESALQAGAPEDALPLVDVAISHPETSSDPSTWLLKARILAALGNAQSPLVEDPFADAATALHQADSLAHDAPEMLATINSLRQSIYQNLLDAGALSVSQQEMRPALLAFTQAQQVNPQDTLAYDLARKVANDLEMWPIEMFNLEKMADLKARNPEVYAELIHLYQVQVKDTAKALSLAKYAVQNLGYSEVVHLQYLQLLEASGLLDAEEKALTVRIYEDPELSETHYLMGFLYEYTNRPDLAVESYRQAAHLDERYAQAWRRLGMLFAELAYREKDREKEFFTKAIGPLVNANRLRPQDPSILSTLIEVYKSLGMKQEMNQTKKALSQLSD